MKDSLLRFEKHINLEMVVDFDVRTTDIFKSFIGDLRNQGKQQFEISDFSHLFKIENLTDEARINFIETSCNIKFISMNVNQVFHRDDKPFTLNLKVRDKLNHVNVWYVAFSDSYDFNDEDDKIIYASKNDIDFEFNKERLKNCNIKWQTF
jgi:hypothetical protein